VPLRGPRHAIFREPRAVLANIDRRRRKPKAP